MKYNVNNIFECYGFYAFTLMELVLHGRGKVSARALLAFEVAQPPFVSIPT